MMTTKSEVIIRVSGVAGVGVVNTFCRQSDDDPARVVQGGLRWPESQVEGDALHMYQMYQEKERLTD